MATYLPAQQLSTPFEDYPNQFLKCFVQGTTTPLSMATDAAAGTLLAKAEISGGGTPPIGFIKTAGGAIFIPYLNAAYDAWIFPTSAEADANDTSNAIKIADNVDLGGATENTANSYANVANVVSDTTLTLGRFISTSGYYSSGGGGANDYEVVAAGTGTADGGKYIDLPNTSPPLQLLGTFPDSFSVLQFGAVGDGATDDTVAIQATIDAAVIAGVPATFDLRTYRINSTVNINDHNTRIEGNGASLDYYGSSVAVDFVPIGGVAYPVSCSIKELSVLVRTAVSGTGFRIRASHSTFDRIDVVLFSAATSARGITLVGDDANGTGPYYNTFIRPTVQSQSGSTDHIGISLVANAPNFRSPNANTFIGGRVGQCLEGIIIKGNGNVFYNPTVENSAGAGTCITFEADTVANCVNNSVFGAYIENALLAFSFTVNAASNSVYSDFVTGAVTVYDDLGSNNIRVSANSAAILPNGVKLAGAPSSDVNVLDAYEEGTWTPVPTNLTVVGTPTYTGNYIKIGKLVAWTLSIAVTTSTAATKNSTNFAGLPFVEAIVSPCNAVDGNVEPLGEGFVSGSMVFVPSWSARVQTIFISGYYIATS